MYFHKLDAPEERGYSILYKNLRNGKSVGNNSNQFLLKNDMEWIRRRLHKTYLSCHIKLPLILPKWSHLTTVTLLHGHVMPSCSS
jgi:hypothetical protein